METMETRYADGDALQDLPGRDQCRNEGRIHNSMTNVAGDFDARNGHEQIAEVGQRFIRNQQCKIARVPCCEDHDEEDRYRRFVVIALIELARVPATDRLMTVPSCPALVSFVASKPIPVDVWLFHRRLLACSEARDVQIGSWMQKQRGSTEISLSLLLLFPLHHSPTAHLHPLPLKS